MKHLFNRTWDKAYFNWYGADNFFSKYKSARQVEYFDTMSSAGDWSGIVVFESKKKWAIVPFWQENRYPRVGYRVNTGLPLLTMNERPDTDLLAELFESFNN